jgi:hypothetical protein
MSQPKKTHSYALRKVNVVEFYDKQKDSVRALAGKFQIGKTQTMNIRSKRVNFYNEYVQRRPWGKARGEGALGARWEGPPKSDF